MITQTVNISSFQKNLTDLLELVIKGDEIIITKSNTPIARVSPVESKALNVSDSFFAAKAIRNKRVLKSEAPEIWFG